MSLITLRIEESLAMLSSTLEVTFRHWETKFTHLAEVGRRLVPNCRLS